MSEEITRDRSRRAKRQSQYYLNRSIPYVARKISKINTAEPETSKDTRKMSHQESDQFRDLSATIMSGNAGLQRSVTAVPVNDSAPSTSKQAALADVEQKIEQLVNRSVCSQMNEIKKTLSELTTTMSRMSIVVQHTQEDNKKLREHLSSTSKNSPQHSDLHKLPALSNTSSRSSSRNSHENYRSDHKLRMDKWGIEFNGDNNILAVEDFVFRVERLQSQYDVPWKEVMDNFHLLVKGAAEKWYWLFIRTNYVTEWTTLRQALLKQYQPTRSSFELMRDMVERRQLPGETIDEFFFAMIQLRSRLSISMPEAEIIKMIKKNLRENIGKIVYPMAVSTVEELRICCIDAEKTFLRRDLRPSQAPMVRYPRHVNEIYDEPIRQAESAHETEEEVAEVLVRQPIVQQARPLVCWNCHQNGHAFMDCPSDQRTIFCYKCGKPDVTSPNCADCRKRNFQRNEGKAGNRRSLTNPQQET